MPARSRRRVAAGAHGRLAVVSLTVLSVAALAAACGGNSSSASAPTTTNAGTSTTSEQGKASSTTSSASSTDPGLASVSPKDAAFIKAVKNVGVNSPDDVIISAAQLVCAQILANPNPPDLQTFVKAMLSAGTTDEAKATSNAKQFITIATNSYCKK